MKKFEYDVLTYEAPNWRTRRGGLLGRALLPTLSQLGELGWEVVGAYGNGMPAETAVPGWRHILLKRRLAS